MLSFKDKIVLCTGSAGHIASVAVEKFLAMGARVITTDLSFPEKGLSEVDFSANPVEMHLDITMKERVDEVVDTVAERYGALDVVVNAAGILNIKPFLEITEEEWDRTFDINVKGMFLVCQAALKKMIPQKNGCFVNFASISGKVGGILAGADYSASKAAVICLTKSLAKNGAPHGVRANSVAPGAIYSPMLDTYYPDHAEEMAGFEKSHPFGRFGEAEEVANTVLFLASREASFITGACIDVNGGTLMD